MAPSSHPSPGKLVAEAIELVRRVGGSDPDRRLRWLVAFLDREVSDSAAAALAHRELSAFCMIGMIGTQSVPREVEVREWAVVGRLQGAPSLIQQMQRLVRDALRSLVEHGRCRLPFEVEDWVWRPEANRLELQAGGNVALNRFYAAVYSLVAEVGVKRLGLCSNADCRRLFVRKARQTYCGPRCSQRVRTERFRERNPERVRELRHAVHERKQRARFGPRVVVGRHPRQRSLLSADDRRDQRESERAKKRPKRTRAHRITHPVTRANPLK